MTIPPTVPDDPLPPAPTELGETFDDAATRAATSNPTPATEPADSTQEA